MYMSKGARITSLIWGERWALIMLVALAFGTELVEPFLPESELYSVQYVAVLATALSIFLVFRFNEAYDRWWEARKLWGSLVNHSRDFARQVITLYPDDEEQGRGIRRLVYRQIAFVHALRIRLRHGDDPEARARLAVILRGLLPDEAPELLERNNVPAALLTSQSHQLARRLSETVEGAVVLTRFDASLGALFDVQGACERIKTTVFPDAVTRVTRLLVWGLALMLLVATLGDQGREGVTTTVVVVIMAMAFISIDSMGHALKNPFENAPNDTPMTSLSTTIERDLREMLGETELPEPVQPVKGVLM
jgi:putative membrane protein